MGPHLDTSFRARPSRFICSTARQHVRVPRFWLCLPRSDYNYVEYMFLIEYEAISFVFVHVLRSNRHSVVEATELTAADVALPDDDSSIT